MEITWKLLLVVCICLINILPVTCGVNCWNDKLPGQKIEGIVGEDINITCVMISEAYKSCEETNYRVLYGGNGKQKEIPSSDIFFMNRTLVKFTLRTTEEMLDPTMLNVRCGTQILTFDEITIGTPPQNVTDFYCRFIDCSYFICRFKDTPNNLNVTYQFEILNDRYVNNCTVTKSNGPNYYCDFHYSMVFDKTFYFTVFASNNGGQNSQTFIIDHDSNLVPSMPNTEVTNITSRDIVLISTFPTYQCFEQGLRFHIRYRPEGLEWHEKYLNKVSSVAILQKLDLGYANRKYELEIRVRSINSNTSDDTREIWSDPFKSQFKTLPRAPDNPPKIPIGCYYIDNSGYLFLYWERLDKFHENAENLSYVISAVKINHSHDKIQPKNLTLLYAKYAYDEKANYTFEIRSKNAEGLSSVASNINVPARKSNYGDYLPQDIFKVYNNNNNSYNLSWTPPKYIKDLLSYTVFWCIQSAESHNACNLTGTNSIKFQQISHNQTWYIFVPPTHNFIFAVSANYRDYSSGMTWAKCGKATDTDYLPLTPDLSAISSTEIKVKWNLECSEKTNLNKYNFTYCPIISNLSCSANNLTFDNAKCSSEEKTISVTKNIKEFSIKDLKPFTAYKVSMVLYSDSKNGAKGKATSICTQQDAPTPPRELSVQNVTAEEAILKWLPPKQMNGELQSYTIGYTYRSFNGIEKNKIENINVTDAPSYKLKDLLGYTNYTVHVSAQTIKESQPQIILFQTKIGRPSSPMNVEIDKGIDFYEYTWDKPSYPGGPIDYYEIKITFQNGNGDNNVTKLEISSQVNGNRCKFYKPQCRKAHELQFDVTAVNVIKVGASRKHRHTKAEISQSAKNVNANESINDEVENTKEINYPKKNLKPLVDFKDKEKRRTLFGYDFDNRLDCENNESFEEYDDIEIYEKFQSTPISKKDFFCESVAETNQSSIKDSIIPLSVLVLIIMFISFYFVGKKLKKMTDIKVGLPEGLCDIMKEDTNIKCQDILKSHNENNRSNEPLGQQELNKSKEEKQYLLDDSTCNDFGSNNDNSAEDQETKSQHADDSSRSTVEMMDYSNKSYVVSPSESPQNSIRDNEVEEAVIKETKPAMLTNGYIEPKSIQSRPERTITGYTTLDAIGKPIIPTQSSLDIENNKLIIPTSNHTPTIIGGYVTQKQLSEFGRLQ